MRLQGPVTSVFLAAVVSAIVLPLTPAAAHAQSVVNPIAVEFSPSSDHDATQNGNAMVSHYDLQFYQVGAAQPFQVNSVGKPTPSNGVIRLPLSSLGAVPAPGITYQARAVAVGPGGTAASPLSNTFAFSVTPSCSYALTPATQSVSTGGGGASVSVTAPAGCAWNATSSAEWLTIVSGGSGSGSGTIGLSAAANPQAASRSATVSAGGQSVTLIQSGGCVFTVSPTTVSAHAGVSTGTISVTAAAGCSWTAVSHDAWIAVTSGTSGSGDGSVGYAVAESDADSARTGTLTVAGHTVTITQSALPPPPPPVGFRIVR